MVSEPCQTGSKKGTTVTTPFVLDNNLPYHTTISILLMVKRLRRLGPVSPLMDNNPTDKSF